MFLWLDFVVEFNSTTYETSNKNTPIGVKIVVDYPEEYESQKIFPFKVEVLQMNGTAVGKSVVVNM